MGNEAQEYPIRLFDRPRLTRIKHTSRVHPLSRAVWAAEQTKTLNKALDEPLAVDTLNPHYCPTGRRTDNANTLSPTLHSGCPSLNELTQHEFLR